MLYGRTRSRPSPERADRRAGRYLIAKPAPETQLGAGPVWVHGLQKGMLDRHEALLGWTTGPVSDWTEFARILTRAVFSTVNRNHFTE